MSSWTENIMRVSFGPSIATVRVCGTIRRYLGREINKYLYGNIKIP